MKKENQTLYFNDNIINYLKKNDCQVNINLQLKLYDYKAHFYIDSEILNHLSEEDAKELVQCYVPTRFNELHTFEQNKPVL